MKFTNKHNLPEGMVKWLTMDEYDYNKDIISATALAKPARMTFLERIYEDQLEMDCSDLLSSRMGTAIHDSFEKVDIGQIQEERFYATLNGFKLSGKPDLIIDNQVVDIKTTSVWKFIKGDFQDYVKQLSVYRWLLWKNGIHVHPVGQIWMLFTDWSASKSKFDASYPPIKTQVVDLHLWEYEYTEKWINERLVAIHNIDPNNFPDCTDEELWKKEDEWAIKKKGNRRALKLYKTEQEAQANLKDGQVIEHRPGEVVRCKYCVVRPFCEQAKELEKRGFLK